MTINKNGVYKRRKFDDFPWDAWISGKFFTIERSKDYDARTSTMIKVLKEGSDFFGLRLFYVEIPSNRRVSGRLIFRFQPWS